MRVASRSTESSNGSAVFVLDCRVDPADEGAGGAVGVDGGGIGVAIVVAEADPDQGDRRVGRGDPAR